MVANLLIKCTAGLVALRIAGLQIDQAEFERRDRHRPGDSVLVVAGLDDRAGEARDADAVGAHLDRHHLPVWPLHLRTHRLRVLGAEEENVADLDAARGNLPVLRHLAVETRCLMLVVGRRIERGPALHDRTEVAVEIGISRRDRAVDEVLVAEHLALAGVGEDDELVAEVAADGPGLRRHRNRAQSHARERAQVGDEHPVVGLPAGLRREVEGVGILHQELAAAHHAEPRAHLVAELPLDVIEVARQLLVAFDRVTEDLGDHLLVGGTEEHLALVPVLDAQHLLAVGLVAARLAPQVGRLDGRHQHLDGAGAVLLLAHDLLDLLQHAQAEWQPGVDAGALLLDHGGTQHQLVRHDLRFLRRLAQHGEEVAG
jgi:hypothetical protein